MRPVRFQGLCAVARVAIATLARSGVLLLVAGLLAAGLLTLPAIIRADGTVEGQLRLTLLYSLHFTTGLIGLTTLWTACGALARDIRQRQIQLVAVKPVPFVQIWAGKWVGLLCVQAFWLAIAGLLMMGVARWKTRSAPGSPDPESSAFRDVLTARRAIEAEGADVTSEAEARLRRLLAERRLPPDVSARSVRARLVAGLQAGLWTVPPSGARTWTFILPRGMSPRAGGEMTYRLSGTARYRDPVTGVWVLRAPGGPELLRREVAGQSGDHHRLELPAGLAPRVGRLEVTFENRGRETVLFDPRAGVRLLLAAGSLEGNLARALAVMFCRLALLAALGLTAGARFSLPVAGFVTAGLIAVLALSHSLGSGSLADDSHAHSHGAPHAPSRLEQVGAHLGRVLDRALAPCRPLPAAERLAGGIWIPGNLIARAAGWWLGVYPAFLGVAGTWILARRELALPEETGE